MNLRINTNTGSLISNYQLKKNQAGLSDSLKKIATGKKINKASDDAAGMVIARKLASEAQGLGQAAKNASDAVSITQIADGALGQAAQLVQNIRAKAIQAAGPAQSAQTRQAIQQEISQSLFALKDIAQNTTFNGRQLLSGAFTDTSFQIGASSGETIEIPLGSIDPAAISDETYGSLDQVDVTTFDQAQAAIAVADAALVYIDQQRSAVGSIQNQLESTINNLLNVRINTLASAAQIMDVDYAEEAMNLDRLKTLAKAKAFAQAQANASAGKIVDIFK